MRLNPAGYLYKRVAPRPDWVESHHIRDIYSVAGCISADFCDYIDFWEHNGYWLFDTLELMEGIARDNGIPLGDMTPFFYRVHPCQWVEETRQWEPFSPEPSFKTDIREPAASTVAGFDVVSFHVQTAPECSPLSCNNLAEENAVNEHCLFDSFIAAKTALESGAFKEGEPGPFRIIEVDTL